MKRIEDYTSQELDICLRAAGESIKTIISKKKMVLKLEELILSGQAPRLEEQPLRSADTTRFGEIEQEVIIFNEGILGFEELKEWFLVDPLDSTSILWLQSTTEPKCALPVFPANKLNSNLSTEEYYVLSIPSDIRNMTANTKAPILINGSIGQQIVGPTGNTNQSVYKELKKVAMDL